MANSTESNTSDKLVDMIARLEHADPAIRWAVAALVLLNETVFLSRLWIVSKPPPSWPDKYLVTAMITTISYAISEPLWTVLFRQLPIPAPLWSFPSAFAIILFSFLHSWAGVITGILICEWMHIAPRWHIKAPGYQSNIVHVQAGPKPAWIYPVFLLPVQTVAVCNAALICWSHDIHHGIPTTDGGPGLDAFIHLLALASYVGFGLAGDFWTTRSTYRAMFLRSGDLLLSQLGHLGVLLVLRLCVRKVVGLDMFPVLPMK